MTTPDRRRTPLLLVLAATLAAAAGCATASDAPADRQAEVAERGRSVMPFDLDRTTHRFAKTATGGVQTVVADDPADAAQIRLIQQHLRQEADRFRAGDFGDPAQIHGDAMPGLATLRESAGKVSVDYAATAEGGRITYRATETVLVTALHAWFDAQVSDHGQHAIGE